MKNLMSLLFVLTFWSSYSSANYLDDQVLKYCKTFMAKYLGSDSKNFTYRLKSTFRKTKKSNSFESVANYEKWCVVNNETKEYSVKIFGWKSGINHRGGSHLGGRIDAHRKAEKWHNADKFIPVGAIEYTQNVFHLTKRHLIMYVAINRVKAPIDPKFDQKLGAHSVN